MNPKVDGAQQDFFHYYQKCILNMYGKNPVNIYRMIYEFSSHIGWFTYDWYDMSDTVTTKIITEPPNEKP